MKIEYTDARDCNLLKYKVLTVGVSFYASTTDGCSGVITFLELSVCECVRLSVCVSGRVPCWNDLTNQTDGQKFIKLVDDVV